jgi:hypothetical protein
VGPLNGGAPGGALLPRGPPFRWWLVDSVVFDLCRGPGMVERTLCAPAARAAWNAAVKKERQYNNAKQ